MSNKHRMAALGSTWPIVALLAVAASSGCSNGRPETFPVEGQVQYPDGTRVTGGALVEFESAGSAKTKHNARGRLKMDGTFQLTTFVEGDGAVLGSHNIVVIPQLPDEFRPGDKPPTPTVHPRFRDYLTSGLKARIAAGANKIVLTVDKPD